MSYWYATSESIFWNPIGVQKHVYSVSEPALFAVGMRGAFARRGIAGGTRVLNVSL